RRADRARRTVRAAVRHPGGGVPVTAGSRALQARVVGILTHPAAEWPVIAGERTDAQTLMLGYAAPLAAIPAVCRWIGLSMIRRRLPLAGTYRVGILRGFVSAFVSWIFALAAIYVSAVVIERLDSTYNS